MSEQRPRVYIIIINYLTCADTVECLESVLKNTYPDYRVIVVNNNAADNDLQCLLEWAGGKREFVSDNSGLVGKLTSPPCAKPVGCVLYTREQAENGGDEKKERDMNSKVVFIDAGSNGGYAAGNNIGIKYALAKDDFEYVWLLNNDTVIKSDSLQKLVETAVKKKACNIKTGMIGPKLMYYDRPDIINGVAGLYNKWSGTGKLLGAFQRDSGQFDRDDIVPDYVSGAAMLASKDFIKETGLLNEEYFLYYEEIDWAIRGLKNGYSNGYCHESVVYHKEGATIGSSSRGKKKSEKADFYGVRNRLLFTRKYYPGYLWSVYLSMILVIINRVLRGQFSRVKMILNIVFGTKGTVPDKGGTKI